ncbi:unnamed protein product (macronuclear) [Paramecium tetraurelia]|uniref:RING-type domain-containing protein n=1 Tax=Paramecium tetraurelia TaxID=5888 RepID=A0BTS6_PARTE|nr:uncharacterized protein GSPATT00032175001 [Paramecium tetraurelia]CAK61943.1 unnamed protein product [Paramecium tetraurelia]|eukprot:XP_001429341.1 hypothetical protein (macronuclear) [Paramecium tetraurelia strain d4-2]
MKEGTMTDGEVYLNTCHYAKNPQITMQEQEKNQIFISTSNPKIKIVSQQQNHEKEPIQQQQEQIFQQAQPSSLNQTNYSNQQVNNLEQIQFNNKSIYQQTFNQTIMKTTVQICKNCTGQINQDCISLPCLHSYHKDCLYQQIQSNIDIDQVSILCVCKIKIPQNLILQMICDNKQLRKKYFVIQLFDIITRAPPQVQQRLLGQAKYTTSFLKTLLNDLMIEDDTPQKIEKK